MIRRPYNINGTTVWLCGKSEQDISEQFAAASATGGKPKAPTFKEYCTENWQDISSTWCKTLAKKAGGQFKNHIHPYFDDMKLNQINRRHIQRFIDSLNNEGFAKSTVKNIVSLVSDVFRDAVRNDVVDKNPIIGGSFKWPDKVNERKPVPFDEYGRICNSISQLPQERDQLHLALIAHTGMRREEVCALCWEDINFETRIISVNKAVQYPTNQPVIGKCKTKAAYREIYIIDPLMMYLEKYRRPSGFILHMYEDMEKPYTDSTTYEAWKRIQKALGFSYSMHCFRHTYTGLMATNPAIPIKVTQYIIGHADIATTMNRYANGKPHNIHEVGKLLNKSVTDIMANCYN